LARCLIIGCGCRGLLLARSLLSDGHCVRGTTRDPARAGSLEAAGVEPWVGDPERVATLAGALEQVTIACLLLGSAAGSSPAVAALHGTRLEMLLSRMLDSTVRGIVYEAAGSVPAAVLAAGAGRVRSFCEDSRVPYALLSADPAAFDAWSASAAEAVNDVLGGESTAVAV